MAMFETEPEAVTLYDETEEGVRNGYHKVESITVRGGSEPTYMVGSDDVWTADNYLCIRVENDPDSQEQEIHKIPHDRIKRRKYIVEER